MDIADISAPITSRVLDFPEPSTRFGIAANDIVDGLAMY